MKKLLIITLVFVLLFCGCKIEYVGTEGESEPVVSDTYEQSASEIESTETIAVGAESQESGQPEENIVSAQEEVSVIGTIAEYDDAVLELIDAEFFVTETGEEMIQVNISFTNNSSTPYYASESFAVVAYQNNTELLSYSNVCRGEDDEDVTMGLSMGVSGGASINAAYVFELNGDGPVEVQVCTPTADLELLAMDTYAK